MSCFSYSFMFWKFVYAYNKSTQKHRIPCTSRKKQVTFSDQTKGLIYPMPVHKVTKFFS